MSHQSELISKDINAYLAQHKKKGLLKLLTCGHVDDGKSTLIGRLLHDSNLIYEDHLVAITNDSIKSGTSRNDVDLALLTDGLKAEREQGITIDVAYRYFSTSKRKFIIADTPGHAQYTRNMVTGASNCDMAIILINAKDGMQPQTRRHSIIVSLLGIRHMIIAINKMDLVGYDQKVYTDIKNSYLDFAKDLVKDLHVQNLEFIPLSALHGHNVVNLSKKMPWYQGTALLNMLETIKIDSEQITSDMRFPVQYVTRPDPNFRGYCGSLAAGTISTGDAITALPSYKTSTVKSIITYDQDLEKACAPMAITVTLEDEIDVSRGDMLVPSDSPPLMGKNFNANIIWMAEQELHVNKPYYLKFASKTTTGYVSKIWYGIDINTLAHMPTDHLGLNDIGHCRVTTNTPVAFDPYLESNGTGSLIMIDRLTNMTVGAGIITQQTNNKIPTDELRPVSTEERHSRYKQQGFVAWLTGDTRQQTAYKLERLLFNTGQICVLMLPDQDYKDISLVIDQLTQAGLICLCPLATPPDTLAAHSFVFDCDQESVDSILATIATEARLN